MVQRIQRRLDGVSWVDLFLGALRIIIIVLIVWGAFNTLRSGKYTPSTWINLTISGLAQGSIYALIALGYTLVYGILLMINFAHGEVFMAGAFTTVFFAQKSD
jgi:branched-chain amino acid transport system permease protein